eukprot:scaffold224466_cov33-Tisochrysis_lutea.AAC.3
MERGERAGREAPIDPPPAKSRLNSRLPKRVARGAGLPAAVVVGAWVMGYGEGQRPPAAKSPSPRHHGT